MKNLILSLSLIFVSQTASAVTEIACWNSYAKKGSRPTITAQITQEDSLIVTVNAQDSFLVENYVIDDVVNEHGTGAVVGYIRGTVKSDIGEVPAQLIESNRSPYKGNIEYAFDFATYDYKNKDSVHTDTYKARWILPSDLSPEALKAFRFENRPTERVNSVMIMEPSAKIHQFGDNILKLFCTSK